MKKEFKIVENLNELPEEMIGTFCEILYFSDCFNYVEVLCFDDSQWFIDIKSLDPQGE